MPQNFDRSDPIKCTYDTKKKKEFFNMLIYQNYFHVFSHSLSLSILFTIICILLNYSVKIHENNINLNYLIYIILHATIIIILVGLECEIVFKM